MAVPIRTAAVWTNTMAGLSWPASQNRGGSSRTRSIEGYVRSSEWRTMKGRAGIEPPPAATRRHRTKLVNRKERGVYERVG
jgi:hypothetical protein